MYESYAGAGLSDGIYFEEHLSSGNPLNLVLSESYKSTAMLATVIVSLVAFALFLFAAIAIKKARPLGIVTAVMQPIGLFAGLQTVLAYSNIDFGDLVVVAEGSSMDDVMSQLNDKMYESLMNILPNIATYFLWAMVLTVCTVVTLIYVIMLFKTKAKACAVVSMVLLLLRHFVIPPVSILSILQPTQEIQSIWDVVFRATFVLPALLIGIQGLVNLVTKGKKTPAVAPMTEAEEQPVAENPTENV